MHPVKSQLDSPLVEVSIGALPFISIMTEMSPGFCHLVSNIPPMAFLAGNTQEISLLQTNMAQSGATRSGHWCLEDHNLPATDITVFRAESDTFLMKTPNWDNV